MPKKDKPSGGKSTANKTDVIAELGVRTKPGKVIDGSPKKHKGGSKVTKRDNSRGLGVDVPAKTPNKNNGVGRIINDFTQSNRYL